jgi:UDP-N-acetylglucosamine--N-acetylmuramyl-(pentapeptide) pyrophosphoryl-undecaprenol N-acetylglucosamine transferase
LTALRIVVAGGGTGGHVFPAIAVVEAIQRIAATDVTFCGTARGVEARVIPARGWRLELLEVEPIKGRGAAQAVRAAVVAARATARSVGLLRRLRPSAVLSVGGYAAGPLTLAAALGGVPVAVLEPNRVVGLTNRIVAPFAKRAYVAWDDAARAFRPAARRPFGVPVREGFAPRPYVPHGTARVLVMGGSQGASALNDRLPDAVARLRGTVGALDVVHQAGPGRDEGVRAAYASRGVERVLVAPFLDDVAGAIADADVVVARAGAGTIAEIAAVGRASILVPFPSAADDHQGRNAEGFAQAGAAVVVRQADADAARLAGEMTRILLDDGVRARMADAARSRGRPSAAHDVAVDLLAFAQGGGVDGAAADVRRPLLDGETT